MKLSVASWGRSGTGTFTLPDAYANKTCGKDYYIYILAENVNDGTATDYASVPVSITISESEPEPQPESKPVSINGAAVTLSATSFTYNGKVQKPSVKKIGGNSLVSGTDYTLSITNNKGNVVNDPKNAGSYSLIITGKGKYTGHLQIIP